MAYSVTVVLHTHNMQRWVAVCVCVYVCVRVCEEAWAHSSQHIKPSIILLGHTNFCTFV